LTGKTAIVTRGYSGIGVETVCAFRSAGAKVLAPARDIAKAKANLTEMPDAAVAAVYLLAPVSIDGFAEWFLRQAHRHHFGADDGGIARLRRAAPWRTGSGRRLRLWRGDDGAHVTGRRI
jgi:NAD(P)-dependent dehydrogenase (short-subunit alcohol dehydrogenase family)